MIEAAIGHLLLSGNAYLEVVRPDGEAPRELYALRPDRVRIVPDVSGVPRAYRYEVEGRSVDWPVDPITGASDVLHLRDFHPLDDWYGLSPIEAAAAAIDQHNAAAEHNAALLQNGARPSGALVFRSDPGPDGIRRVEEALLDRTQGPRQAGRPLVLGGDVDWKELGFSPKDMDFAELKAQAAREIAAAFGVPHLLVVSGEAAFSNRADARLELWEHTVIPLLDRVSSALTSWLGPMFGENLRLVHDLDEIPALGYAVMDEPGAQEAKNSENFRRLYGYPQPRIHQGQPFAGRWTGRAGSSNAIVQFVNVEDDDDPLLNPFPEDADCVDEWRRALRVCFKQLAKRPPSRTRGIFGPGFMSCLLGQASERCGGRRVFRSRKSAAMARDCDCGIEAVSERADMDDEIRSIDRLMESDRYYEAIHVCNDRLQREPDCREARARRATALRAVKRLDEALLEWERVSAINPDDAAAHFCRGELLLSQKKFADAVGAFNRAEELDDGYFSGAIPLYRAKCHILAGSLEKAAADIASIAGNEDLAALRRRLEQELAQAHQGPL